MSGVWGAEGTAPVAMSFLRLGAPVTWLSSACAQPIEQHRAACAEPGLSQRPAAGLPATLTHCDTLLLNAALERLEGLLFYLFSISLDNLIRLSNLVRCLPCEADSFPAVHSESLTF